MMKTASKPADVSAEAIRFGVEIETMVPASAGLTIGSYHGGRPVVHATALNGSRVTAPVFGGHYWKAERDGSITTEAGYVACEFVSPILHGEAGIQALREFVRFARANGAIEFRAFAGSLNEFKVLHHVATALGLMRRAAVARVVGRFQKSPKKNRAADAVAALRRLPPKTSLRAVVNRHPPIRRRGSVRPFRAWTLAAGADPGRCPGLAWVAPLELGRAIRPGRAAGWVREVRSSLNPAGLTRTRCRQGITPSSPRAGIRESSRPS